MEQIGKYKVHPAANIFPMMSGEKLDELTADIRENGLRLPVMLLEGQIIDGRNRAIACLDADVTIKTEDVGHVDDVVKYVLSLNKHRRHQSKGELALVSARAYDVYEAEAKKRKQAGTTQEDHPENLPDGQTVGDARDKAGEAFGISGKLVDAGRKIVKHGAKELVEAVERGEVSPSTAAEVATLPKADQKKAVKEGKKAVIKAAKKVKETKKAQAPKKQKAAIFKQPVFEATDDMVCFLRESRSSLRRLEGRYGTYCQVVIEDGWNKDLQEGIEKDLTELMIAMDTFFETFIKENL